LGCVGDVHDERMMGGATFHSKDFCERNVVGYISG
jgi:hypothetical protein